MLLPVTPSTEITLNFNDSSEFKPTALTISTAFQSIQFLNKCECEVRHDRNDFVDFSGGELFVGIFHVLKTCSQSRRAWTTDLILHSLSTLWKYLKPAERQNFLGPLCQDSICSLNLICKFWRIWKVLKGFTITIDDFEKQQIDREQLQQR